MGWSTWNYIGTDPTAAKIEAQAAALKSSGLLAAGYNYVNIDDFYYECPGSQGPNVDANGLWVVDPSKFGVVVPRRPWAGGSRQLCTQSRRARSAST